MIKIIRANQKKFLAGLTILSMVTFLVNRGSGTKDGSDDRVFATANGKKIYLSEFQQARAEQQALRQYFLFDPQETEVSAIVNGKDELFMLLRHEANELGVHANKDEVQTILKNQTRPLDSSSDQYILLSNGIADLLKILSRVTLLAQAEKVSKPQVDQQLVIEGESMQLKLVQLLAADFISKVPPPTTQQMQEQFTKYADTVPRHPIEKDNPFGFGYKLPQRAAFQYLRLTDDALNLAAISTKDPYTWDVDAHKYYYKHISDYPTTVPIGPPSTQPLGPKPFDLVEAEILKKLRKQTVDDLRTQITLFITSTMNADWQNYSKFIADGAKGTEPDSSLGVPYTSFTYLIKLDEAVRAKFQVEISPDHTTDPLPEKDIYTPEKDYSTLTGVGSAAVTQFITSRCNSYLELKKSNDPTAPSMLIEPSASLEGPQDTVRIFIRVTEVKPAEAPSDLSIVSSHVADDFRTAKAYDLAKQQANVLVLAAKSSNLDTAALAAGRLPISALVAGDNQAFADLEKLISPPLGDSAGTFFRQSYKLLKLYDPQQSPHPIDTFELPALPNSRVFVGQLQSVKAAWNDQSYFAMSARAQAQVRQPFAQALSFELLSLPSVIARMDYKPLKGN